MTTRILSEKKAFICYFVNTTQLLVCVAHLDFAEELTLSNPGSAPLGTIGTLDLVQTGFSKIEPVTCKTLTFLPKNTGIKMKTMHARDIYEKVGQVT